MPTFLWSGRTASGQKEAEEVEAATALDARKILESRGWTDLRQHTSEISDFIQRQSEATNPHRRHFTAKEKLQYHEGTAPGLWTHWIRSIGQSIFTILLLGLCIFLAARNHYLPGGKVRISIYAVLLAGVVFLYPALRWWYRRTKRLFVRLHTARTWQRWDEVLQCLNKLAVSKRQTNVGVNDYSLARYRALALAGLGRMEEAVSGFRAASDKAGTPQWLYHVMLASIYTAAQQYEKAQECYYEALEEAPDKPVAYLDLGMLLVKRFNRPAEANQLLERAEKLQLSELEQIYVPYLRGLIAFRKKNYEAMDVSMRETFAVLSKRAAKKYYIFEASILTCQGYLAVSSAALGRKKEAQRYFAESEKYLRLIGLNEVLSEYEMLMRGL